MDGAVHAAPAARPHMHSEHIGGPAAGCVKYTPRAVIPSAQVPGGIEGSMTSSARTGVHPLGTSAHWTTPLHAGSAQSICMFPLLSVLSKQSSDPLPELEDVPDPLDALDPLCELLDAAPPAPPSPSSGPMPEV
jgi:hypothetical protein